MNEDVYEMLDESAKHKLQFERVNHENFFKGDFPEGEFWILKLIEDGSVPWYRDEAFCYYYTMDDPADSLDLIDEDKAWTIQLNKTEPDTEGEARFVVTEAHDFALRRELADWLDGRGD